MRNNKHTAKVALLAFFSLSLAGPLAAQLDAGQVLRELTPEMLAPLPTPAGPGIDIVQPGMETVEPGGARASISRLMLSGNSVFSDETLTAQVEQFLAEDQDLAGLRSMANTLSRFYREQGYLFARAVLPPQTLDDGSLQIEIVEGRYGAVSTSGHPDLAPQAQRFLAPLQTGSVIHNDLLERTTLLLSDQPGIDSIPVIRPGQTAGTGDLTVEIRRAERFSGTVMLDNHGNRYTGRQRLRVGLNAHSNFMLGDELSGVVLYTAEDLLFGSLRYGLPLNGSGLRGFAGIRYTDYELGKDFSALGISGRAQVSEAGLSYPFIRSRQRNLRLQASIEYKDLKDRQAGVSEHDKSILSIPLNLLFDVTDDLGGWGVTYGGLTFSHGDLRLDEDLRSFDLGRAEGSFQKLSWDLNRIQDIGEGFSLMGRLSGQHAWSNLDSYEGMGLGGPYGVRAFPVGEANGDRGLLGQLELRYQYGDVRPFVFYDFGRVTINADDFDNQPNSRSIAGAGAGLRYQLDQLEGTVSAAWRTRGGSPQAAGSSGNPSVWASIAYHF